MCEFCNDECNSKRECRCDHENKNAKPHHRHPVAGEVQ